MAQLTSEILAVGDELVRGIVADTNSSWLAARLWAAGAPVRRITLLGDDTEAVAAELSAAVGRGAGLVVTTGGLGPTHDDRTLEAVARACGRRLEANPQALQLVAARYRQLAEAGVVASGELTAERAKMALLPSGAQPLPNEVGTAPGAVLRWGGATVICLPGVPAEMRALWEGPVAEILATMGLRAGYAERTVVAACPDESVLAPLLAPLSRRHPGVYVKSRAAAFEAGAGLRVTLAAGGADAAEAAAALEAALADLRGTLAAAGIALHGTPEPGHGSASQRTPGPGPGVPR